MSSESIPVAEGVFREGADGPRLIGSRCPACGSLAFPQADYCHNPGCGERAQEALLGPTGVIWSYTVLHYPPPEAFQVADVPYAVAQVDLDEGIRVSGMVSAAGDLDSIEVGMPVDLVIERVRTNQAGQDVLTWKFAINDRGGSS